EPREVHKQEEGRRNHKAAGRTRRPPYVIRAFAPNHSCRRPFRGRNPDPAIGGVKNPGAIMISCPGPRVVTHPVPPYVCPLPMAFAEWLPLWIDVCRLPDAAIRRKIEPRSVIGQRIVEVCCRTDFNPGRKCDRGLRSPGRR